MFRFEWQASLVDVHRQRLFLSIKNNSPLFAQEQTYMGDVSKKNQNSLLTFFLYNFSFKLQIDLSNLDLEKTSIAWYGLQEPNTSGGGIMKIKYDTLESNEQNTQL